MFNGDYRVVRVVLESKNPIETLHNLRNDKYSIFTFFEMLEILDIKQTMIEDSDYVNKSRDK